MFERGAAFRRHSYQLGALVTVEPLDGRRIIGSGRRLIARTTGADLHGSLGRGRLGIRWEDRDESVPPIPTLEGPQLDSGVDIQTRVAGSPGDRGAWVTPRGSLDPADSVQRRHRLGLRHETERKCPRSSPSEGGTAATTHGGSRRRTRYLHPDGPRVACALRQHGGLVSAGPEDWADVEGVGAVRATRARDRSAQREGSRQARVNRAERGSTFNRRPPPYHGGSGAVTACTRGHSRARLSWKSRVRNVPAVPARDCSCSVSCTRLVPASRCPFSKQTDARQRSCRDRYVSVGEHGVEFEVASECLDVSPDG